MRDLRINPQEVTIEDNLKLKFESKVPLVKNLLKKKINNIYWLVTLCN